MANRLQHIDRLHLTDHSYLTEDDECYFYGEYTARKGFSHSDTNKLILNFKKELSRKGKSDWKYKTEAIKEVANIFTSLDVWEQLKHFTWIPIPPSKDKNDPNHDDRLIQTLQEMKNHFPNLDYRELVKIKQSRQAAHGTEGRPTPQSHYNNFQIEESIANPEPETLVIFDDVLTTGSGFKAMKRILLERFQDSNILGVFIARTRRDADPIDEQSDTL